jgi:hypothetical protein
VCEDDNLQAMDREMLRLVLLYRRSTVVRQALDAPSDEFGEQPVAPPWPRPVQAGESVGIIGLDDLAENLVWLQSQWQQQQGLPSCFETDLMQERRLCLLSIYLQHIHRLRVWMPPSMEQVMKGDSQGPFEVKCEGLTYSLAMTRTDGAVRWMVLEWNGDPRAPEIASPLLMREVLQGRSVDGWGSRYTTDLLPDEEWPPGAARYNLQFETAETAMLTNEEAGSVGASRRCRLRASE